MTARLRVQEPVKREDGFGTAVTDYRDYRDGRPIPAERRKLYGSSVLEVREDFADYRAEYYVYWNHRIGVHWRVTDVETGILYEVKTEFPDRANNLRRLCCERVNT